MIDHVRNDINVTPLVDVMLVLLIIFMLMTLIMGRGHDVTLPKAKNFSQEKDKMQPVVSIDIEGNLWVEKSKLGPVTNSTLKEMQDQVEGMWKAPKNPDGVGKIYLKADDKVEYIKVYPVLEYLNKVMLVQQVDLAVGKAGEEK
jgi:biopolymer transport protein ExbD